MSAYPYPASFLDAESRLQAFASGQGYPATLVWVFPEHASLVRKRLFVHAAARSKSRERVISMYEAAVTSGAPIQLNVLGHDGSRTCAFFAPEHGAAGTHPSNPLFSLSASTPAHPVTFVKSRFTALVLRLLGARNRYFTEFLFGRHAALVAFGAS